MIFTSNTKTAKRLALDLWLCISFANLCALNLWHDVFRLRAPFVSYYRASPAGHQLAAGTLLATLALGCVFFAVQQAVKHWIPDRLRRLAQSLFVLCFLLPVYPALYVVQFSGFGSTARQVLDGCVFVLITGVLFLAGCQTLSTGERPFRLAVAFNQLLSPLLLISLISYAASACRRDAGFAELGNSVSHHRAAHAGQSHGRRIIWAIFDELGYEFVFKDRPRRLKIPELDKLRAISFFATDAFAPSNTTLVSMPALINGAVYSSAQIENPSTLDLVQPNGKVQRWAAAQSVFADMRASGARTCLVGWFHPYCRILGDALSECVEVPSTNTALLIREAYASQVGIWETGWYLLRSQIALLPLVPARIAPGTLDLGREEQLAEFRRIHDRALSAALSPDLDFVMIHYPVPHPYGIYSRKRAAMGDFADSNYLDNVALVDRVLRELQDGLESAGLWDRTFLLISGDHGLRNWDRSLIGRDPQRAVADGRVPFIVRMPGQTSGLDYTERLSTVDTKAFLMAIRLGEVSTVQQAEAWFRNRRFEAGVNLPGPLTH